MSNSDLEVSKANRSSEMSKLNDLTKFRLDEMNKVIKMKLKKLFKC